MEDTYRTREGEGWVVVMASNFFLVGCFYSLLSLRNQIGEIPHVGDHSTSKGVQIIAPVQKKMSTKNYIIVFVILFCFVFCGTLMLSNSAVISMLMANISCDASD